MCNEEEAQRFTIGQGFGRVEKISGMKGSTKYYNWTRV